MAGGVRSRTVPRCRSRPAGCRPTDRCRTASGSRRHRSSRAFRRRPEPGNHRRDPAASARGAPAAGESRTGTARSPVPVRQILDLFDPIAVAGECGIQLPRKSHQHVEPPLRVRERGLRLLERELALAEAAPLPICDRLAQAIDILLLDADAPRHQFLPRILERIVRGLELRVERLHVGVLRAPLAPEIGKKLFVVVDQPLLLLDEAFELPSELGQLLCVEVADLLQNRFQQLPRGRAARRRRGSFGPCSSCITYPPSGSVKQG